MQIFRDHIDSQVQMVFSYNEAEKVKEIMKFYGECLVNEKNISESEVLAKNVYKELNEMELS